MQATTLPTRMRSLLSGALVAVILMATLTPTAQASSTSRADAADWIAAELEQPEPGFDVFGKTAARNDVIYALAAAGGHEGAVRKALSDLRDGAADYIGPKEEVKAGALAKVLLSVLINREDPTEFLPGRDLEGELRGAMVEGGMFASDVFSQALAVMALGATDNGVPEAAVIALTSRQCDAGDFTYFGTCPSESADIDTTALAILALLVTDQADAAADAANWLAGIQNDDGSFPNAYGDPNANSAGVAAMALRAAGENAAADLAAGFVESLQLPDGGIRFVAADTEANGYATLQGILAFDAPPLYGLVADPYGDVTWEDPFAMEIDWLGDLGVTRGCNPPTNSEFCPDELVTRGQMAAFLSRFLELEDEGTADFTDDDGSIFHKDIARLAAADITKGCNPPTNDRFCPDDPVTRAQMAAFLHRAIGGDAAHAAGFVDDDGSVFEADIEWLAGMGITKGCNPPTNDRFCPDDPVTRAQMAAFLYRASRG